MRMKKRKGMKCFRMPEPKASPIKTQLTHPAAERINDAVAGRKITIARRFEELWAVAVNNFAYEFVRTPNKSPFSLR